MQDDIVESRDELNQEAGLSSLTKVIVVLVVTVAGALAFLVLRAVERAQQAVKVPATSVRISTCQLASMMFYTNFGRWPVALPELANNSNGLVFIAGPAPFADAWGRPLLYVPPIGTNTPGSISSLGADGLPGGTNFDADIVIPFP